MRMMFIYYIFFLCCLIVGSKSEEGWYTKMYHFTMPTGVDVYQPREYFENLLAERTDPVINFENEAIYNDTSNISVKFKGIITIPSTANYTFRLKSSSAVQIMINGKLEKSQWIARVNNFNLTPLSFKEDQEIYVTILYYERVANQSTLKLEWNNGNEWSILSSDYVQPDRCGDNVKTSNEECDNGDLNVDYYSCEYQSNNCTFCNTNCKLKKGTASFCGDNVVSNNEGEECDNGIFNNKRSDDTSVTGWYGRVYTYEGIFNDSISKEFYFQNFEFEQIYYDINFHSFGNWMFYQGPRDNYTAQFSGIITVPTSGNYKFQVSIDDAAEIYINGNKSIDSWFDESPRTLYSDKFSFEKNEKVTVTIFYLEEQGLETLQLFWSIDGGKWHFIDSDYVQPNPCELKNCSEYSESSICESEESCNYCNKECKIENGTQPVCGDSIKSYNEECDDGPQNFDNHTCSYGETSCIYCSKECTIQNGTINNESTVSTETTSEMKTNTNTPYLYQTSKNVGVNSNGQQVISIFSGNFVSGNISVGLNTVYQVYGNLTVNNDLEFTIGSGIGSRVFVEGCLNATGADLNLRISDLFEEGTIEVDIMEYDCLVGQFDGVVAATYEITDFCLSVEEHYTNSKLTALVSYQKNPCIASKGISVLSSLSVFMVISVYMITQ